MIDKSCPVPDCPCCKHCYSSNQVLCCSAFPNGIPKDYLFGSIQVKSLKECNNGYKYEEIKESENAL